MFGCCGAMEAVRRKESLKREKGGGEGREGRGKGEGERRDLNCVSWERFRE